MLRVQRTEDDFFSTTAIRAVDTLRSTVGEISNWDLQTRRVQGACWYSLRFQFANGTDGILDVMPTCGMKAERYNFFGDGYRIEACTGEADIGRTRLREGETLKHSFVSSEENLRFIRNGTLLETEAFIEALEQNRPFSPNLSDAVASF